MTRSIEAVGQDDEGASGEREKHGARRICCFALHAAKKAGARLTLQLDRACEGVETLSAVVGQRQVRRCEMWQGAAAVARLQRPPCQ